MKPVETINAQIISKIMAAFPAIPFTAQEKLEDIVRPAFKVILDEIKSERYAGYIRRIYPVRVAYFAANLQRPKSECFDVYERLEPVLFDMTDKAECGINLQEATFIADFNVLDAIALTAPDGSTGEDIENLELMEELK